MWKAAVRGGALRHLATLCLAWAGAGGISRAADPRVRDPDPAAPAGQKAGQSRRVERGRFLYRRACQTCHGVRGNGNGPTARFLNPQPRDFTRGVFKWRTTTSGALPTDADLERTIREGVPGTDMPTFGPVFGKADRMALVAYVKTFSSRFRDPVFAITPQQIVKISDVRPFPPTPASRERGRRVYGKMQCAKCHGSAGKGDGPSAKQGLKDDWGRPIEAYDFTRGYYKSGKRDVDLYRTFTTGLGGTPMPAFGRLLSGDERWALVDYIRSLSPRRNRLVRWFREKPQ